MNEGHLNSLDLAPDLTSTGSPKTGSLQKIYRKGDRIYHVNDENVTMLNVNEPTNIVSDLSDGQVDKVASGESLYKTFSFDNDISKEETEKCISFWRSVVEKNLEPIKCTIIENLNSSEPHTLNVGKDKGKEGKGKVKEKKQKKKADQNQQLPKRDHLNSVWFNILEELQNRRLNRTKLLIEKRCRICEYATSGVYEKEYCSIENQLGELDVWQPTSTKQTRISGSRSPGKTSISSYGSRKGNSIEGRLSLTRRSTISGEHGDKELIDEVIIEEPSDIEFKPIDDPLLMRVKEASSKIEYIDAIEMKKREQIYSKWRHNKVEKPCRCLRIECDCNTNPAVVAIIKSSDTHDDLEEQISKCELAFPQLPPRHRHGESHVKKNGTDMSVSSTCHPRHRYRCSVAEYLEDLKENNQVSVEANANPTISQEEDDSERKKEITILKPLQDSPSSQDSIEISDHDGEKPTATDDHYASRESYGISVGNSSTIINEDTILADVNNIATKQDYVDENDAKNDHSPRHEKSILKIRMGTLSEKGSHRKSVAVLIQCTCSNEACDCKQDVEVVHKETPPAESFEVQEFLKIRPSLQKVDSKELIRERLSNARLSRMSQLGLGNNN